jgi:hypothetical protein
VGIFALKDIYIKINRMNPISDKIQALIDTIIAEARIAPAPEPLSVLFNDNPTAKYFSIVQRLKGGGDTEYDFRIEDQNGYKMIRDINTGTKTKGCLADANVDTMIYGDQFRLNFGKCGPLTINNVVGVKLYADENAIKAGQPLDSYELDTDLGKDEGDLIAQYHERLKDLNVGDAIYFDSKFKWDGEVTDKFRDSMNVEINRDGIKGQPINLQIDLRQNPFYIADGEIMFKANANKRDENATPVKFDIPIKKFTFNQKTKPKKEKPVEKHKTKEVDAEEEIYNAKKAAEFIANDPLLKQAFYSQPSFMELLRAEITGKKAVGKGIITTLNLVGNYQNKKFSEALGAEFKVGGKVVFLVNNLVDIKYFDKKKKQDSFVLEKGKKYNAKVKRPTADDQYTRLVNLEGVNEFEILVKRPTETENVYLCDIIKIVNVGNERKEYPRENVYITMLPSDGYQPLKKEPKQKSRFEK